MKSRLACFALIATSLLVFSSCSSEAETSNGQQAEDAVAYLVHGAAVGDYFQNPNNDSSVTWSKADPNNLVYTSNKGDILRRIYVKKESDCVFDVRSSFTPTGQEEKISSEIKVDFSSFKGLSGFAKKTEKRPMRDGKIQEPAGWVLDFSDQCAVKATVVGAKKLDSEQCSSRFEAFSEWVKEDRLQAAQKFFKEQVCAGQKF